jgi:hypothetical protein
MKSTLLSLIGICLIALTTMLCCKKKSSNPTYNQSNLNQLFSGLRSTPQSFTVTAGASQTVVGANGTVLNFYPNSFKNASGTIITSGTINLQLVEMYKPGDMIQNRAVTTTSDGQLLQSGGEINIIATMNGQEIYANKYGIGFKQSGPSSQSMELYYGSVNNVDSVITWTVGNNVNPGTTAPSTIHDSVHTHNYLYLFDSCTNFLSVNCDDTYTENWANVSNTTVSVTIPDEKFNPGNTDVYIVATTFKKIAILAKPGPANSFVFSETFSAGGTYHTIGLPIGLNYELVVLSNINGSYYYYQTSGIITNGMTINAAVAPETRGDIIARLAGL